LRVPLTSRTYQKNPPANKIVANVRVFAKAGNSLIVQPETNAHLKKCC
jgi:hypothetical protein